MDTPILRSPVSTIVGHVDVGKPSLLDFFRKSSIVSSEDGGITQKMGLCIYSMTDFQEMHWK